MDDFEDDNAVAGDFYSIVGSAQYNELVEVEQQRERDREAQKLLAEQQKSDAMTLMQIAGMKTKKELDTLAQEKNAAEEKRSELEEKQRKEAEHARLVNQFPPPDLKHQ